MADPQLLERAQLLQKAKMLQQQKLANNSAAFPGPEATGVPNGPTPAATGGDTSQASETVDPVGPVMGTLGAAAKVLDTPRGVLTAPALALLLKGATGKDVASLKDWGNAANPTNLSMFPSSSEMFEKAGVPEGAKLSDVVPGYSEPGEGPWYKPEKGGLLDPTLRGAGGLGTDVAIDPLTYVSLGGASAAKKAAQTVSKDVLEQAAKKGIGTKILESVGKPVEKAASALTMPTGEFLNQSKIGKAILAASQAPSEGIKSLGKKVYSGVLQDVEHEGAKFGKDEVANTLFNAKVKTPFGLNEKAGNATDALLNARNKILKEAGEQGAEVDMKKSMQDALGKISELRATKDSDAHALADSLEAKIAEYQKTANGVPGTPDQIVTERGQTGVSPYGQPIMGDVQKTLPGKPGVAPAPYSPQDATKLKTFLYSNLPTSTFQQNLNAPISARIKSAMSTGLKTGVEDSVASKLGPKAGQDLAELNAEAGKLLSTRKAQTRVGNKADRILNNTMSVSGTDSIMAPAMTAMHGDIGDGLTAMLIKKAIDAGRLGTMPIGYGLRSAGEGALSGPLIDAITRQTYKSTAGRGSETERIKRGKEQEN